MNLEDIKRLVDEYAEAHRGLRCAAVYGSFALGELEKGSDIDVLLVVEGVEGMETWHELLEGRIVEATVIGEKLFNEMVKESNPFIAGVLLRGVPIFGRKVMEASKTLLNDKKLRVWSERYFERGLERLKRVEEDVDEVVAAFTLFLNAYLLASGDLRLSYSLDKLEKRIEDKGLKNMVDEFMKSKGVERIYSVKKIAEMVRLKLFE